MKTGKRKQSGFTLLELMVVLAILGILSALIVPNLMGNKEKADHQKVVSDINTLENVLEMYKLDNNHYPSTEEGLEALVNQPTGASLPNYKTDGYIRRLPKDPWGNEYQLLNPGIHSNRIDIFSAGPDGEIDTDDDIGNWNLQGESTESR